MKWLKLLGGSTLEKYSIFISVGTQLPFDRLVKRVEQAFVNKPEFKLIYQVGVGGYKPSSGEIFETLTPLQYSKAMGECDVLIAHCGTGSIVSSVEFSKPLICMPRRAEFGEHRNNHQVDAASKMDVNAFYVLEDDMDLYEIVKSAIERDGVGISTGLVSMKFVSDLDNLVLDLMG